MEESHVIVAAARARRGTRAISVVLVAFGIAVLSACGGGDGSGGGQDVRDDSYTYPNGYVAQEWLEETAYPGANDDIADCIDWGVGNGWNAVEAESQCYGVVTAMRGDPTWQEFFSTIDPSLR